MLEDLKLLLRQVLFNVTSLVRKAFVYSINRGIDCRRLETDRYKRSD